MSARGKKKHRGLSTGAYLLKVLEFPTLLSHERWASSLPLFSSCDWQMSVNLSQLCSVAQGWGHVTEETVIGASRVPRVRVPSSR